MSLIRGLCRVLDFLINPVILITAVLEVFIMCTAVSNLIRFRYRITKLNSKTVKPGKAKKIDGTLTVKTEVEMKQNWDDFDLFLEDYQREGWWYSVFSMIIQIFTLLGILGTVAGLYLAMSDGEDMYHGVELALSSTVYGIMAAVIFKVFDILITSFLINYIEDGIERYEKIYQVKNEESKLSEIVVTAHGEKNPEQGREGGEIQHEKTQKKNGSGD